MEKQIKELEEERIRLKKEIRSLNSLYSQRDQTIREMNQKILRLMVENEKLKRSS